MDRGFTIYAPALTWLDKSAPEGQQRRIGGIISTESKDREDEIVLQDGLDFSEFLAHGWFNDNHSRATNGPVGEPVRVLRLGKGDKCPDGVVAPSACHYAEGWLYEGHPPADAIWDLAQTLQKNGSTRRLGYSIEGAILQRQGPDRKVIARAKVRNVAITNCPVNTQTHMSVLAKALREADQEDEILRALVREEIERALTSGSASGQALQPESLDGVRKSESWLSTHLPFSHDTQRRFLRVAAALKDRGDL